MTKRITAILLAVLLCLGNWPRAYAAAGSHYHLSETPKASFGISTTYEPRNLLVRAPGTKWTGGFIYGPAYLWPHKLISDDDPGLVIYGYCLEHNAGTTDEADYEELASYAVTLENLIKAYQDGILWKQLVRTMYLAQAMIDERWNGCSAVDISTTGQIMIWELMSGYFNLSDAALTDQGFVQAIDYGDYQTFRAIHAELLRRLQQYPVIPSIMGRSTSQAPVIVLDYDVTKGDYRASVTDTNGALEDFLEAASGTVPGLSPVRYERQGNKVTFISSGALPGTAVSAAIGKKGSGSAAGMLVYGQSSGVPETGRDTGQIIAHATNADPIRAYFAFQTEEVTRPVTIRKVSAETAELYAGNPLYKLEGARFTISSGGSVQETVTTDASGQAVSAGEYPAGTVLTIREVEAPAGYLLNQTAVTLTVSEDAAANTVTIPDRPATDPDRIRIRKADALQNVPSGNASLAGAEFTLSYYRNLNAAGRAYWTGVFRTDERGIVELNRNYLKTGTLPFACSQAGDIEFPLGSVRITETAAPRGYQISDEVLVAVIRQANPGGPAEFVWNTSNLVHAELTGEGILLYESPELYSLTVRKTDSDGTLRAGAEFDLINRSEGPVTCGGKTVAPGGILLHLTTDSKGVAGTGQVLPLGTYGLVETKAPEGCVPDPTERQVSVSEDVTLTVTDELIRGSVRLVKVDAEDPDIKLTGAVFTVYTEDGTEVGQMHDLGDGSYELTDLTVGSFYVLETEAPAYYEKDDRRYSFRIESEGEEVVLTDGSADYEGIGNHPLTGSLSIRKQIEETSQEGYAVPEVDLAGFRFRITGTASTGQTYEQIYETDAEGKILVAGLRIGTYTVEELPVEGRTEVFILPEKQTHEVSTGGNVFFDFEQVYRRWRLQLYKEDAEKGDPRGDATLAGAVYGIYRGETLIDTYTTDGEGSFVTREYLPGTDWSLREITPPAGYRADEEIYPLDAAAPEEASVTLRMTVPEQVILGRIHLFKQTEEGIDKAVLPESDAVFEIYLKSSGSYENASEDECATLTTDSDGSAVSPPLPYGLYTVHQVSGWEGREQTADFDVMIEENEQEKVIELFNANFYSYLMLEKTDEETGKRIPLAGAVFELRDEDGDVLGSYVTNAEGRIVTPEEIPYGRYQWVEIEAPLGYLPDPEPIPVEVCAEAVDQERSAEYNRSIIYASKSNRVQMARIRIFKSGEQLAAIRTEGELYIPVYQEMPLAGATFEIIAAEDIHTPEGTMRQSAGTVVDIVSTGEDGYAESILLFPGQYLLVEIETPRGMVPDPEPYPVTVSPGAQTEEVVIRDISLINSRQHVEISLWKVLEGEGDLSRVSFGLYAREPIVAADGSSIPADGLLETAVPGASGQLVFKSDVPTDAHLYVRELESDSHYCLTSMEYDLETSWAEGEECLRLCIRNGEVIINNRIRIGTTLTAAGTSLDAGGKILPVTEDIQLKDLVNYRGLRTDGRMYRLTGVLMDRSTGEVWTPEGEPVRAVMDFVPITANGRLEMTFTFPGAWVTEDLTLVAFETLTEAESGLEAAIHADLTDEGQTVQILVPRIRTTVRVNGENGREDKPLRVTGLEKGQKITVGDLIQYQNLIPDTAYEVKTRLMRIVDGEAREIMSSTTQMQSSAEGSGEWLVELGETEIVGSARYVIFEQVTPLEGGTPSPDRTEEPAGTILHEDLEDIPQLFVVDCNVPTGDQRGIIFYCGCLLTGGLGFAAVVTQDKKRSGGRR